MASKAQLYSPLPLSKETQVAQTTALASLREEHHGNKVYDLAQSLQPFLQQPSTSQHVKRDHFSHGSVFPLTFQKHLTAISTTFQH